MSYTLMGTEGCHLCEVAATLIVAASQRYPLEVWQQDISEDDALMARYALQIPVLVHNHSGDELKWPFDQTGLEDWLNSHATDNMESGE